MSCIVTTRTKSFMMKKDNEQEYTGNTDPVPNTSEYRDFDPINGRLFELTTNPLKLTVAGQFEQNIWLEEGYGSLEDYEDLIQHSITFTAFDESGKCNGIARLFQGKDSVLPFLDKMSFYEKSEKSELLRLSADGEIEELGTIAVSKELRNGLVFENLARLAYRYSYGKGIKYWGIIMEPERVKKMNRGYGFTFRQLGPTTEYQGGECAAFIMDLQEVNDNMRSKFSEAYDWFVNAPLNKINSKN